jgi:hypothetical protein
MKERKNDLLFTFNGLCNDDDGDDDDDEDNDDDDDSTTTTNTILTYLQLLVITVFLPGLCHTNGCSPVQ